MTAMPVRPALTVAAVLDLRVSARAPSHDTGNHGEARYAVGYNGTADTYELRASPVAPVLCSHRDINVIGALLRGERFEPGFIARVLDAGYAPDEVALDADERERRRRTRVEADAQARARRRQEEDEARARRALMPTSDLPADATLDDLFRTL